MEERFFVELEVDPEARNPHRTTVAIVGWVGDVLKIEAYPESLLYLGAIVRLRCIFRSVVQSTISDEEVVSTAGQI
jgi:hypothetical protein